MSFLKSLIQRLLDSRTTLEEASHASKPATGASIEYSPSSSIGTWGQVLSDSVAVSDGYIWASGRTTAVGGFAQVNTQAMQVTTSGTSIGEGEMLNLYMPVSKGQVFVVYGRSLNAIVVRLVKTIGASGGGYNLFLRRALPCLKPSFNYLLRSFCKANPSGLVVSRILQNGSHSQTTSQSTFLQLMGTWVSTSLIKAQITALMSMHLGQTRTSSQEKHLVSQLVRVTLLSQVLYLLRRVTGLLSAVRSPSCGSHRQWGANINFRTGGASC